MTYPPCLKLYKSELNIIEKEMALLIRLRTASYVIGLPVAAIGLISLVFPNMFGNNITIDNLSKFTTVFFGGIFFASINLFNKGDLLTLRKRREHLLLFINEYDNYEEMTALEKKKVAEECDRIITKLKGL